MRQGALCALKSFSDAVDPDPMQGAAWVLAQLGLCSRGPQAGWLNASSWDLHRVWCATLSSLASQQALLLEHRPVSHPRQCKDTR